MNLVANRREAGLPDWLPGVRQRGTQLSATLHRVVDRPRLFRSGVFWTRLSKNKEQLNTLQTVVLLEPHSKKEVMVKPHGGLVPVS